MKLEKWILAVTVGLFFLLTVVRIWGPINTTPLHDFDEANRAEGARNMRIFNFYWAPITGSPYLRESALALPFPGSSVNFVNYHLERPPLVFNLMNIAVSLVGDTELAYRFPSFIFGILLVLAITIFSLRKDPTIGLLMAFIILTAYDWWMLLQMALLDTAVCLFIFLSLFFMVLTLKGNQNKWRWLSAIMAGLAILSKGQMAVLLLPAVIYLWWRKHWTGKEILTWFMVTGLIILPWIFALFQQFGIGTFFNVFAEKLFIHRAIAVDTSQKAPFFWYFRWWLDSFRPGIILFLLLLAMDIKNRNINESTSSFSASKKLLLVFIATTFGLFSIAGNKVWWYVLPALPAVIAYIYLSIRKYPEKIGSFVLVAFLSTLPILRFGTNKEAFLAGGILMVTGWLLIQRKNLFLNSTIPLILMFSVGIYFFNQKFPFVVPSHPEMKEIGAVVASIKGEKCLFVDNVPYEAALFYSKTGEINLWQGETKPGCQNLVISTKDRVIQKANNIYNKGMISLWSIENNNQ